MPTSKETTVNAGPELEMDQVVAESKARQSKKILVVSGELQECIWMGWFQLPNTECQVKARSVVPTKEVSFLFQLADK